MILLGIDTGGTFTDVTAIDPVSGRIEILKVPSTPNDPSEAFWNAIQEILRLLDVELSRVGLVVHGTTVATNAIVENKGARAALITTEGFRYVLDLGRHDIPRDVNLYAWSKPERPITPDLIFEVVERVGSGGEILRPLDLESVRVAVAALKRTQVQAVAVSLLHGYVNAAHEQQVRAILEAELPGVAICCSHEVLPVFREYERTMITAMNARVMPLMSGYIRRIQGRLKASSGRVPFLIMKSNGGVASADAVARQPVFTAMSGLAAGVQGACLVGRVTGSLDLISLDIGGTSTDVALCPGATPIMAPETQVGAFPLRSPAIDIRTIGAGGGSIAKVHANGSLTVGPDSAGADPGPACYARGGQEPTVTDAQLVLGRIPAELAGGHLALDRDHAVEAITERVAHPLSLTVEDAAFGIVELLTHNIAGAVRAVSIERGHDASSFALVACGGAGPIHAPRLAEVLGMERVVLPRWPGVLSALGLLATPHKQEFACTCMQTGPNYDHAVISAAFETLEKEALAWLREENLQPEDCELQRVVESRYPQQGHELPVLLSGNGRTVDADYMKELEREFHRLHRELYGFAIDDSPVQIVNLRITAIGKLPPLDFPRVKTNGIGPAPYGERPVFVDPARGFVTCPAFRREDLPGGALLEGPAVVDQLDTTMFLPPDWRGRVDPHGNIIMTTHEESS